MSRIVKFVKEWMLPLAIAVGILLCLAMNYLGSLPERFEPRFSSIVKDIQPVMVAFMLFLQFNKISPHDLRLKRWHLWLLFFQTVVSVSLALAATAIPQGGLRLLV